MSKPIILTGIRANNDLTIGNYFGAILPMIDMATKKSHDYQVNMFVPDLHSFTTPTDLSQLKDSVRNNVRLFVAAGLPIDNPDIYLYRQSYVPAHSEFTWILDCFTGKGEMERMTQYKDKSAKLNDDRVSMGLFNYPVLMAADILLYGATYVPVGDDQSQHLEFTRTIGERINAMAEKYGHEAVATVPKAVKDQHEFFGKEQGLRIKDLSDPRKKMSKSDELGKGVIFLNDAPKEAAKKVMSATTDSLGAIHYDWDNQPGIANLLDLLALLTVVPKSEVIKSWEGKTGYGDLKSAVASEVEDFLTRLQSQLDKVEDQKIATKIEESEVAMNLVANATLLRLQKVVGLR